jgi:hypothetical protein
MWLFLTAVMLGLLIHRLSLAYQFDQEEVRIRSWWGLGKPESIRWINLSRIYCQNSFTARAAGVSHLVLESSHPEESSLILLAQKKPEELRCRLLDLARARGARLSSPDGL